MTDKEAKVSMKSSHKSLQIRAVLYNSVPIFDEALTLYCQKYSLTYELK